MTPRFFQKIRDGIPFRRETPQPPTPAVRTHAANGRARAANRARNKQARASRKRNRV